MAQWGVELTSNDPTLLSFLAQYRKEPSWSVVEVEGKYYLLSSSFQGLTSPEEVKQTADNLLFLLNGILKLKFKSAHLEKAGDVVYLDNHGQIIRTTSSRSITVRANISAGETFYQSTDAQQLSSMDIWLKAQGNSTIQEALQHFANQTNWFNLYKVYEVVEHDVDKTTLNKWAQGRAEDFTYSANNASVSQFDARHSSAKFPKASSKRTPMSLLEATEFVANLLRQWLQSK